MSFFDYDTDILGEQLLPPKLRQPKQLAWLKTLFRPTIQWLRDFFFDSYSTTQSLLPWVILTNYNRGDRVIWGRAVYQCKAANASLIPFNQPTGGQFSDIYWFKLQDLFIGADERLTYNSQLIKFEYELNKYFLVPSSDPQIYITNNFPNLSVFVMGDSGQNSSVMYDNSLLSSAWMYDSASFPIFDGNYTINVPAALFATLGTTSTDQENTVRNFANKYNLAGLMYGVTTF